MHKTSRLVAGRWSFVELRDQHCTAVAICLPVIAGKQLSLNLVNNIAIDICETREDAPLNQIRTALLSIADLADCKTKPKNWPLGD